jgi:hypothetical protein
LPDFSLYNIPKRCKNIPNDYKITKCPKIYPMVVKYSKRPTTFPIPRSSKTYPNGDFWSENKPSGNPAYFATVSFETNMHTCGRKLPLIYLNPIGSCKDWLPAIAHRLED